MGNNKKNKVKNNASVVLPTVSILTINQIKRQETIKLTVEHINNQTYKNIIEWVIVEGSKSLEDCIANEEFIKNELKCNYPIVYVPGYHLENDVKVFNGNHLGELRNISNRSSKGDICVVFDDDDWYPATRVEHSVKMLSNSKCEIAGCSSKYLYDYGLQKLFKFKAFGPNHSTNDCFAYKRSYFDNNIYDSTKDMAEESSFTKNFTNPMVQLDPKQTIIGSSHHFNTFNKKEICIFSSLWQNPSNPSEGMMYPQTVEISETAQELMSKKMVERYTSLFNGNENSEYDISYTTGGTSIEWDPTSQSLGGSEQAVVHLSTEWTRLGKKVAVYGKLSKECTYLGVDYIDWKKFPFHKNHSIVILSRMAGVNCFLPFNIKTKKLYVDFHDSNWVFRHPYLPYVEKIDKIFFKSQFHLEQYESHFKMKLEDKDYTIIPNGIRIDNFIPQEGTMREPYRFCYASCYTRGLLETLAYVWPVIFQNEPRAELHVYYGMDGIQDQQQRQQLMMLMGQPGVMDHGRRPVDEISMEKQRSTFHLYLSRCSGEIDCISVRESLVAGCIPLISNFGVFKDRDGLHFDIDETPQSYQRAASGILNLMKKHDFLQMCRQQFNVSKTIMNWKTVAEEWLEQ